MLKRQGMFLSVEGIAKSFDGFFAVNRAELKVHKGEVAAIIGPNGAGKTTLMNLICGQLAPDRGKIVFKGQDITGLSPDRICRKGIGRSFQVVNIFPKLTVFECVQVAVLTRQKRAMDFFSSAEKLAVEETMDILDSVGLSDKSRIVSGALSHGDQKILEVAIALGSHPDLLVLDEPTAGMSLGETEKTMRLIQGLASKKGLSILFCEHDMGMVFSTAQTIMVMHQGCTIIQGSREEVRANKQVQQAYLGGSM
jgi:branched-chain amino acid transport system ATP-binding protein